MLYLGYLNLWVDILAIKPVSKPLIKPTRLLSLSKNLARRVKQLEYFDPLVQELTEEASLYAEYLNMLNSIENKTENKDLPPQN